MSEGQPHSRHIAVVGEMGVGKTTIGRLLAQALDRPFFDSDEMIENEGGLTGVEIVAREGVSTLHDRELGVFEEMCGSKRAAVLAPAASVVDRNEGRELLRSCTTVWLEAPEAIVERRQRQSHHRRAVGHSERLELDERRHPFLEEIADIRVDTGTAEPEAVLELVIQALGDLS